MAYQVLARKWRPRKFADLVGQEHVTRALQNAIQEGRLHHAYLLTGTRGVGKTTIARILAKSFNCEQSVDGEPCGVCSACTQIDAGRFVDLLEIDAASNTGIDNIREVLENAQYAPTAGRYKVYIIDEVHMLSKSAFNAMLKTLEEPPEHVKFILATTDPHKVPVTVLSRCMQFVLRNMQPMQIQQHLAHVLDAENIEFEPNALSLLARAAMGSMRDALSLLDQAIALGSGKVQEADIRHMLGAVDKRYLYTLLQHLINQDGQALVQEAHNMSECAVGFDSALSELALVLQQLALIQSVPSMLGDDEPEREVLQTLAKVLSGEQIQLYYQCAIHGKKDLPLAPDEYAGFVMTLLRMLAFTPLAAESNGLDLAIDETDLNDAAVSATAKKKAELDLAEASHASHMAHSSDSPNSLNDSNVQAASVVSAAPAVSAEPTVSTTQNISSPAVASSNISAAPIAVSQESATPIAPAVAAEMPAPIIEPEIAIEESPAVEAMPSESSLEDRLPESLNTHLDSTVIHELLDTNQQSVDLPWNDDEAEVSNIDNQKASEPEVFEAFEETEEAFIGDVESDETDDLDESNESDEEIIESVDEVEVEEVEEADDEDETIVEEMPDLLTEEEKAAQISFFDDVVEAKPSPVAHVSEPEPATIEAMPTEPVAEKIEEPRLPSLLSENWAEIVTAVAQKLGAAQMIAQHSTLVSVEDDVLILGVSESALVTSDMLTRIGKVLSDAYGQQWKVQTQSLSEGQETLLMQRERQQSEEQQQALEHLQKDPVAQELVSLFDAEWLPTSIKPVDVSK